MIILQELDNLLKYFSLLSCYCMVLMPLILIVTASNELTVYRMQHFDINGIAHGARSAFINYPLKSIKNWSGGRYCVLAKLQELNIDLLQEIYMKAGGLLIVVPPEVNHLTNNEWIQFQQLEEELLYKEIALAIYFVVLSPEVETILEQLAYNEDIAIRQPIWASIVGNGFQVAVQPTSTTELTKMQVITLYGQLHGTRQNGNNIPTIVIVAHYDSFSVAPELSFGANSNGSGVLILLELLRIFSNLYNTNSTKGKSAYNLVFILSGGGKVNYQGSKKWLEDQFDNEDTTFLKNIKFVLCLDTVSVGRELHMHVSKIPKENSAISEFYNYLTLAAPNGTVHMVQKKINLAENLLSWEHERYTMRRIPAFTLSTMDNHKHSRRATIRDAIQNLNRQTLYRTTTIIAESLGRFVYNVSENLFSDTYAFDVDHLKMWTNLLTKYSRSPQVIGTKENTLIGLLQETLSKYVPHVQISSSTPDKREKDFLFYGPTKGVLSVYRVKPAVFDLALTICIIFYLIMLSLFCVQFQKVYTFAYKIANRTSPINNTVK